MAVLLSHCRWQNFGGTSDAWRGRVVKALFVDLLRVSGWWAACDMWQKLLLASDSSARTTAVTCIIPTWRSHADEAACFWSKMRYLLF